MLLEAAAGIYLAADFVYHRRWEAWMGKPDPFRARQEVQLPHSDLAMPVPLIFGRVRADRPILAWTSTPVQTDAYYMNMLFVIGAGFSDNFGECDIHGGWIGDVPMTIEHLEIYPDNAYFWSVAPGHPSGDLPVGFMEKLVGRPDLVIAQDGATSVDAVTLAGKTMLLAADDPAGGGGLDVADIPGYRGYLCAFFCGALDPTTPFAHPFLVGDSPVVPPFSFEVSSYQQGSGYPGVGIYAFVGQDSNPVNVLYDLYVAKLAKVGLPSSVIDIASWRDAAIKCEQESIGYSRYIDNASQLDEHIQDVLRTIDGAIRENPYTGKIELKLVRADFDPAAIPHITRDNCEKLTGFAFGGWSNVVNQVDVVFKNRSKDYRDDTATASNPANAVRQDGRVNRIMLQYPGICEPAQALMTAERELFARAVPVMKFCAHVSRAFKNVRQGDAVKVSWTGPDLSGYVMRVADVSLGTLEDGMVAVDLITDTSSYVWRNEASPSWPGDRWRDLLEDLPVFSLG